MQKTPFKIIKAAALKAAEAAGEPKPHTSARRWPKESAEVCAHYGTFNELAAAGFTVKSLGIGPNNNNLHNGKGAATQLVKMPPAAAPEALAEALADTFTAAFIECALWASFDESDPETGGQPLNENFSAADFTPEALAAIVYDCAKFKAGHVLPLYGMPPGYEDHAAARAGHDYFLSRNGHGAGYFCRDELTDDERRRMQYAAKAAGEMDIYISAGRLHIYPSRPTSQEAETLAQLCNLLEYCKGNRESPYQGNPYSRPSIRAALTHIARIQGKTTEQPRAIIPHVWDDLNADTKHPAALVSSQIHAATMAEDEAREEYNEARRARYLAELAAGEEPKEEPKPASD